MLSSLPQTNGIAHFLPLCCAGSITPPKSAGPIARGTAKQLASVARLSGSYSLEGGKCVLFKEAVVTVLDPLGQPVGGDNCSSSHGSLIQAGRHPATTDGSAAEEPVNGPAQAARGPGTSPDPARCGSIGSSPACRAAAYLQRPAQSWNFVLSLSALPYSTAHLVKAINPFLLCTPIGLCRCLSCADSKPRCPFILCHISLCLTTKMTQKSLLSTAVAVGSLVSKGQTLPSSPKVPALQGTTPAVRPKVGCTSDGTQQRTHASGFCWS